MSEQTKSGAESRRVRLAFQRWPVFCGLLFGYTGVLRDDALAFRMCSFQFIPHMDSETGFEACETWMVRSSGRKAMLSNLPDLRARVRAVMGNSWRSRINASQVSQ
jgi:hypothetical protein